MTTEQQQNNNQSNQQQQQSTGQPSGPNACFDSPQQTELNYYRHPGQGTMLAPPGFPPLHYLNKPLSGINMDQATATALEQYAIPDLLPGHMHQTSPQSGNLKKNSDLRLFKCLTCGKDFKQKSTLLQHERIHSDTRPYGSQLFLLFNVIIIIIISQEPTRMRIEMIFLCDSIGCPECLKRFRQQSHLTQHLRIHANEK